MSPAARPSAAAPVAFRTSCELAVLPLPPMGYQLVEVRRGHPHDAARVAEVAIDLVDVIREPAIERELVRVGAVARERPRIETRAHVAIGQHVGARSARRAEQQSRGARSASDVRMESPAAGLRVLCSQRGFRHVPCSSFRGRLWRLRGARYACGERAIRSASSAESFLLSILPLSVKGSSPSA